MKRLITVTVFLFILISAFSLQVFAMTKAECVQYLKDKGLAQEYIIYAENHFKTYDYTASQIDALKTYTDNVYNLVFPKNPDVITKGSSYFVKSNFTNAEEDQILDNVIQAAKALNLNPVVIIGADSIRYIEFYNAAGKKIGSISTKYNTLKYTGPDDSTLIYVIISAVLVLILVAGALIIRKKFYLKKVS